MCCMHGSKTFYLHLLRQKPSCLLRLSGQRLIHISMSFTSATSKDNFSCMPPVMSFAVMVRVTGDKPSTLIWHLSMSSDLTSFVLPGLFFFLIFYMSVVTKVGAKELEFIRPDGAGRHLTTTIFHKKLPHSTVTRCISESQV